MAGIFFALLKMFGRIRLFWLKIHGIRESDIEDKRIVEGKTWEEFCDNLKAAGTSLMYPGTPRDPFQQAEGVRYLTRLTRAALEAFVEYADPAFPVLRRMVHETVKLGADNPDNLYLNAMISGRYEYAISGKRNTIDHIAFYTQNGDYGTTGGMSPCGILQDKDLILETDDSFEIFLTKNRRGKNWLKIENDTSMLIVRQTYLNQTIEKAAELAIRNLDGTEAPAPVTPGSINKGLKTASLFVSGASLLFTRWAGSFQEHTNRLPQFDPEKSNAAGGDAQIIYYHSYWKIETDEALVVSATPPDCDTWNFQLNNYWMESLDYRYYPVTINKNSAVVDKNGKITIVISHKDPGLPNWINTCHHKEGTMCWRWYRLSPGSDPVEPECRLIKFSEVIGKPA